MKRHSALIAIAFTIVSCNKSTTKRDHPEGKYPPSQIDPIKQPKEFHDSIEKAMAEIPPVDRIAFHAAFECFSKRNANLSHPAPLNADTIRELTRKLHSDPQSTVHCD